MITDRCRVFIADGGGVGGGGRRRAGGAVVGVRATTRGLFDMPGNLTPADVEIGDIGVRSQSKSPS